MRHVGLCIRATLLVVCLIGLQACLGESAAKGGDKMRATVEKTDFGKMPDGTAIDLYVLTNASGMKAKVMTYGAILTELHVPDRDGRLEDVVLGFFDLKGYLDAMPLCFAASTIVRTL